MLAECCGLCADCLEAGIYTAADDLHHLEPVSIGGALMDPANVVPLCKRHHDARHA